MKIAVWSPWQQKLNIELSNMVFKNVWKKKKKRKKKKHIQIQIKNGNENINNIKKCGERIKRENPNYKMHWRKTKKCKYEWSHGNDNNGWNMFW